MTEDYKRGWRDAMAEVAAAINCDIDMYKGELWADKIIAILAEIDRLHDKEREWASAAFEFEVFASWIRTSPDIDPDDARDQIARAAENRARELGKAV